MHKIAGTINVHGTIAYVPQQPFIQNDTFKSNILFGRSLDETFYQNVLEMCALKSDLNILSAGDATEIGEKVNNTSNR